MRNDKFLINFVNSLTKKDVFIAAWLLGGVLFAYLFWSYQKKSNQRNFRDANSRDGRRELVVKKSDGPPTNRR